MTWREAVTWVYIRTEPGCYTVGFYDPAGVWQSESDYSTKQEAAERCHWLNGGEMSPKRIDREASK